MVGVVRGAAIVRQMAIRAWAPRTLSISCFFHIFVSNNHVRPQIIFKSWYIQTLYCFHPLKIESSTLALGLGAPQLAHAAKHHLTTSPNPAQRAREIRHLLTPSKTIVYLSLTGRT